MWVRSNRKRRGSPGIASDVLKVEGGESGHRRFSEGGQGEVARW